MLVQLFLPIFPFQPPLLQPPFLLLQIYLLGAVRMHSITHCGPFMASFTYRCFQASWMSASISTLFLSILKNLLDFMMSVGLQRSELAGVNYFFLPCGSRGWTEVSRLAGQAPLPTEPNHQPHFCFLSHGKIYLTWSCHLAGRWWPTHLIPALNKPSACWVVTPVSHSASPW